VPPGRGNIGCALGESMIIAADALGNSNPHLLARQDDVHNPTEIRVVDLELSLVPVTNGYDSRRKMYSLPNVAMDEGEFRSSGSLIPVGPASPQSLATGPLDPGRRESPQASDALLLDHLPGPPKMTRPHVISPQPVGSLEMHELGPVSPQLTLVPLPPVSPRPAAKSHETVSSGEKSPSTFLLGAPPPPPPPCRHTPP
jgi:hypothetical protein